MRNTGNKGRLEQLLSSMQSFAEDIGDPSSQKAAFTFLGRSVMVWAQPETNGTTQGQETLPGFERFVYERLVPIAFSIPSLPSFNIKDGQMLVVSAFTHMFARTYAKIVSRCYMKLALSSRLY